MSGKPAQSGRPKSHFGDLVQANYDARPLWRQVNARAGLTLHQAMLFYGDQADAAIISELTLSGFGEPPFFPLDEMQAAEQDEYQIHSWRLEDRRRRMQISFLQMLRAGKVIATGYAKNSAIDLPAAQILPDRWRLLVPDFVTSSAMDSGGLITGILVFALKRHVKKTIQSSKTFSLSELRRWYQQYVEDSQREGKLPSRDEDLERARAFHGKVIPRSVLRTLRNEFAPAEWKKFGRRKIG